MEILDDNIIKVPGKILLSGGYGILYSKTKGISLSINSNYYIKIKKSLKKNIEIKNLQILDFPIILCEDEKSGNKFADSFFFVFSKYLKYKKNENFEKLEIFIFFDDNFFSLKKSEKKKLKKKNF